MRIAVVNQDLFFRGSQYVTAATARGLAAAGNHVDVIVSKVHVDLQREHPDEKPFALAEGTGFHVLPSRKAMFNVFAMARKLRELKPDVILTGAGHYNECVALAKLIGFVKAPVVYVEHSPVGDPPRKKSLRYRFDRWILQRRVAKVVAVSQGLRRMIIGKFGLNPEKVIVIHNPVFAQLPSGAVDESHVHPVLREKDVYKIVSAGGLADGKAFDVLIEAFAKGRGMAHAEWKLIVFGEGPLRSSLKKKIEELGLTGKVILAGYTKHLLDNFKCADLFAFASRYETFGNVLVEALAAGLPVVCTDCPVGPREILRNGELGRLVPVDDCDALAAAMVKCFKEGNRAAAVFDIGEYTEERSAEQYLAVLSDACRVDLPRSVVL